MTGSFFNKKFNYMFKDKKNLFLNRIIFVKKALKGIIEEAKKQGVSEINESFVKSINEKRG